MEVHMYSLDEGCCIDNSEKSKEQATVVVGSVCLCEPRKSRKVVHPLTHDLYTWPNPSHSFGEQPLEGNWYGTNIDYIGLHINFGILLNRLPACLWFQPTHT